MTGSLNGEIGLFRPIWPIHPIDWPSQEGLEPASPFDPDSTRPIRLTFHTQSFLDIETSEKEALTALADLAAMEEIEALETGQGKFPRIVIEAEREPNCHDVRVTYPDGTRLSSGITVDHQARQDRLGEISIVLAHEAVGHDVFVTSDQWILQNSRTFPLHRCNVMPPSSAARLVGLFLRCRRNYRVGAHYSFQGGYSFYLMRYVLRALWRYFSACVKFGEGDESSPIGLGEAILTRAERALEARDAIGFEYYGGGSGSIGRIEYHFDYLMLLLSGALDAQARIAFISYGLLTPKRDSGRNFRNPQFRSCLGKAGGTEVVAVVERNLDLLRVIAHLRNTIHGSSLQGIRVNSITPEAFHLEVPESLRPHLLQLSGAAPNRNWGLVDGTQQLMLSPYVFADSAVRETFRVINEIADATEVERLVDGASPANQLMKGPPDEGGAFGVAMGRRLAAIGW